MKATDLMIGDWVYCHEPECKGHQVDYLSLMDEQVGADGELYGFGDVKPIPLTPEILEKNGFEECVWSGRDAWRRTYVKHNEVTICIDGRDGGLKHFGYNGHQSWIALHFVHELQHALRLCGIEKEIKL